MRQPDFLQHVGWDSERPNFVWYCLFTSKPSCSCKSFWLVNHLKQNAHQPPQAARIIPPKYTAQEEANLERLASFLMVNLVSLEGHQSTLETCHTSQVNWRKERTCLYMLSRFSAGKRLFLARRHFHIAKIGLTLELQRFGSINPLHPQVSRYLARRAFRITTTSMASCANAPITGGICPNAARTIKLKVKPKPTKMLCLAIRSIR